MPKVVNIPRKVLQEFYWNRKLGTYQVAAILDCSQALIMKKMKQFNMARRTVQESHALTKPKYRRHNFSGGLTEKAYLIGFRLGDLYVSKTHPNSPTIRISTNTTKKAQLNLVWKLFSRYGHVRQVGPDSRGATSIRCHVNTSFDFLVKKNDNIEPWIMLRRNCYFAFLAGYIDAEGTFCIAGDTGILSIKSQDKNILRLLQAKLLEFGILSKPPAVLRVAGVDRRGVKTNKAIWGFTVYRKGSLLRLTKFLKPYLKHTDKRVGMHRVEMNVLRRNRLYGDREDRRWYRTYPMYSYALKLNHGRAL